METVELLVMMLCTHLFTDGQPHWLMEGKSDPRPHGCCNPLVRGGGDMVGLQLLQASDAATVTTLKGIRGEIPYITSLDCFTGNKTKADSCFSEFCRRNASEKKI